MLGRIIYSLSYRWNKLNKVCIQGSGNRVDKKMMSGCTIEIFGNNNTIQIDPTSRLTQLKVSVRGNNCSICIEDHVAIKGGELWLEDNNTELIIGARTTIESGHLSVTEDHSKLVIGSDCMLANQIEIRTGDSHAIYDEQGVRINHPANVTIGNHVWLGSRVMVLKGVTIAEGCVIGAGSIVTRSITTAHSIHAGSPLKMYREMINWTRERK